MQTGLSMVQEVLKMKAVFAIYMVHHFLTQSHLVHLDVVETMDLKLVLVMVDLGEVLDTMAEVELLEIMDRAAEALAI